MTTTLTATASHLSWLNQHLAVVEDLGAALGLMSWDMETGLPPKGMGLRSRQQACLSALHHQHLTHPKLIDTLTALRQPDTLASLTPKEQALVRVVGRDVDQATKLPEALVVALSETTSQAHSLWVDARKSGEFTTFAPILAKIIELNRQQADYLGYTGASPYNALLDVYEPELTVETLDPLFDSVGQRLTMLLQRLQNAPKQPQQPWLKQPQSKAHQQAWVRQVLGWIGFDFEAGRLDEAPHPFCSGVGSGDVRLTNRYFEEDWLSSTFSALHEGGHGLYEQGSDPALDGTPLGGGVSLGIHESQSRLYENQVGRNRAFWRFAYPKLQAHFAPALQDVAEEDFYFGLHKVQPSFIRVEADEVTYNLHIVIRYQLEKALIEGSLAVADLPEAWNNAYQRTLGITPPNHSVGCLQDIHWSHGSFGYFATYTLGNLAAAQLFKAAGQALPTLEADMAQGQLTSLREWLRQAVHQHGKTLTPTQLLQQATGSPLTAEVFLAELEAKYLGLYGV
jgi:carboxypeptidase Taq